MTLGEMYSSKEAKKFFGDRLKRLPKTELKHTFVEFKNENEFDSGVYSPFYMEIPSLTALLKAISCSDKDTNIAVCRAGDFLCAEVHCEEWEYTPCAILNTKTREIKYAFLYDKENQRPLCPYTFFVTSVNMDGNTIPVESCQYAILAVGIAHLMDGLESKENPPYWYMKITSMLKYLRDKPKISPEFLETFADFVFHHKDGLESLSIPASGIFPNISGEVLKQFKCDECLFGKPSVFMSNLNQSPVVEVSLDDLKAELNFNSGEDSESSIELKQQLASYVVPAYLPPLAKKIKRFYAEDTTSTNIMFYGESGSGKTMACKALAYSLGVPYYTHVFSSDSDVNNCTTLILPNTSSSQKAVSLSFDDISYAPSEAYEKLTGEHKDGVTSGEVFELYLKQQDKGYTSVNSAIIEAIQKPSVLELQELFTAPPAVVTFLNSVLDGSRSIRLITGETIHRHPKSVVVVTTNIGYAGYRESTESFLDRVTPLSVELPENEVLKQRLRANTGFDNDKVLSWLCDLAAMTKEYIENNGISHSTVGYRMLEKVVRDIQFRVEECGEDLRSAAESSTREIVSFHVSRNLQEQEDFIKSVITVSLLSFPTVESE